MKELKEKLEYLLKSSGENAAIVDRIQNQESFVPFTAVNRLMAYLLSVGKLSYQDYEKLNNEFRERNKYINLFEMAPRTFGQTWGEQHIEELFPQFIKATKRNLATDYPDFDGEFDLWHEGIRIEVKACRANRTDGKRSLANRAYTHAEALANKFKYHYQQLKPSCCDVFIWIGVCRDELLYWVLTSKELQSTGKLGSQHRNENTGVEDAEVFEGQVFMTEEELRPFLVKENEIFEKVREKGLLQK
ncbi:MAG: restriction endonuclease subunit M [Lachnospiraceae bacterium]|nr:restriction endonuclease subunit M [Lachnospiraceae bacterium]